jgi:hypothetical protein
MTGSEYLKFANYGKEISQAQKTKYGKEKKYGKTTPQARESGER